MSARLSKSATITNPTVEELKKFMAAIPADADNTRVGIRVTPRDRPFDSETATISISWSEEMSG